MSRLVGRPVAVDSAPGGAPASLRLWDGRDLPVVAVLDRWREWFGVLEGEPERDVWRVDTPAGACELHQIRTAAGVGEAEVSGGPPAGSSGEACGVWVLHAWLD